MNRRSRFATIVSTIHDDKIQRQHCAPRSLPRSVNEYQTCHLAELVDKDQNTRSILTIGHKLKMKPIETERQASAAIGSGCRDACDNVDGFTSWRISHVRSRLDHDKFSSATSLGVCNKQWCQYNLDHCCKPRQFRRISTTRGRPESGSAIHTSHIAHRLRHHRLPGDSARTEDQSQDGATVYRQKC